MFSLLHFFKAHYYTFVYFLATWKLSDTVLSTFDGKVLLPLLLNNSQDIYKVKLCSH